MSLDRAKDVQVFPITSDTRVFRSRSWTRLKFEIEYSLQKGTTANSYLIESDRTVLLDIPGESFSDIFINALQKRVDLEAIDYLVLGHINPNRAITLKKILPLAPNLQIVCSNPGAIALRKILEDQDLELNITVIKGDDTLDIGQDHRLEFIPIPNPRYPDLLCTYDPRSQVLYTDKLFGMHASNWA